LVVPLEGRQNCTGSWVVRHKGFEPRRPVLVVGLPGIGFVSKLAVDHLVKSLKAEKVATLYSPYFPNQVLALKNGRIRLFSLRFYRKALKGRDIILLKGDIQPLTVEGQYEVCGKVLDYFESAGGAEVVSMAGFAVNGQVEKPSVYCTSTSKGMYETFRKEYGAKQLKRIVPIVGMAGLLPALSRMRGMNGACVLVETPGTFIDPKGAATLVSVLSKIFGQKLDTEHLDRRAKKAEEMLAKLGEQVARAEGQGAGELSPEEMLKRNESLSYIR
jgi:uncharacterized protein (TIGR00162 family)